MIRNKYSIRGRFTLLTSVVLFSTIEVASKRMESGGAIAGQFPFWLASLRFIISGLILLWPAIRSLRLRGISLDRQDILLLLGIGVLGVTLMASLYHLSITFLPANVAALVFSCNPVFIVLFASLVLSEKITGWKIGAIVLCLIGIFSLARDRVDGISPIGLLLMLVAIIIFALYTVFFKKLIPRYGALPITSFAGLSGGLFLLPIAWGAEGFPLASYGMIDWIGITYLALFCTALGYFFYINGLGHIEASIGSMVFFLKPFLASLFAWIILGETLTTSMLIGGVLILGGTVVALIPSRRS